MKAQAIEIVNGTFKEIMLNKSDLPAAAGGTVTGTIWGLTQNEIAGIMTILIGCSIILHKLVLVWIAIREHKINIRQKTKNHK